MSTWVALLLLVLCVASVPALVWAVVRLERGLDTAAGDDDAATQRRSPSA